MTLDLRYFTIKSEEEVEFKYSPKMALIDNLPPHSYIIFEDNLIVLDSVYMEYRPLIGSNTYCEEKRKYNHEFNFFKESEWNKN